MAVQELHEHIRSLIVSHGVVVNEENVEKAF
jgi:ribulose-5-phosphate 4-epimerase/fuculose-1-phosphate aldolase